MLKFEDLNTAKFDDFVVFLDVDGTIVAHNETETSLEIKNKVDQFKKNNQLYVCSNNRNKSRNEKIAQQLNISVINKLYKKPSKKILAFLSAEERKKPFLVIGDKTFPDGLFAKKIGAEFIKVKRTISGKENFIVRFIYWLDKFFK